MNRPVVLSLAALIGAAVFTPALSLAQPPTAAEPTSGKDQPLPTDPRLVTGELDNGVRYVVVRHPKPAGHAAMWLHVASGSMNETDTQRGLAHYLEHMAFNGSEHFPPGSLVKYFESIGMRFGGDLNAFTNTDQTTFQLNIPFTDAESVAKGMTFLSDVAFRLSLLPDEIEAERQIILNEKMSRSGVGQRVSEYISHRIAPGSLVGERITIGTEERIKNVQKPDFVDYYTRWYVPSNITVLVVADADPAPIVEQIKKSFADGRKGSRPTPQDPKITPYAQTRAIIATDPELENASIQIMRLLPGIPPTVTRGQFRDELVTSFATSAFNRRMQSKLAAATMPFMNASAGAGSFYRQAAYSAQVRCSGKPENWRPMLESLGAELQRARLHGFTQHEIDAIRTQRLSGAEQAVQRESSATAQNIIRALDSGITSGEPVMSAQQEIDILKELLPTITPAEVSTRFAELFNPVNVAYILELPSSTAAPTEAELISLGNAAVSVKPDADAESNRATSLLDKLPTPGSITDLSEHTASHVWSGWLSNGVRIHQRSMDEQKDDVSVVITLAGGALRETAANRGITSASELAWTRPTTSKLSSTDIRDLMNGKKVRVGGGGGGGPGGRGGRGGRGGGGGGSLDTLTLRVSGNPEDLETGMQLAYLLLTDPAIEQTGFDQWKTRQLEMIERREHTPQGAFAMLEAESLYPADQARLRPVTAAQVEAITRDAALAWLKQTIATAPIEVTVVGDLPRERAMELVARYLGSLPSRDRISKETNASLRQVTRPKGPITGDRTVATSTDQAIVRAGFFGPDAENVAEARSMQMAANILSSRMVKTIREEKNLVYSIGASSQAGRVLPGFGMFSASAPTEPRNATLLAETINQMFAEFAKGGPTEDELVVVKKQFANALGEQMKTASFWTTATSLVDYHGSKLDDVVNAPAAFQAMTAEQIHQTFAKYYKDESRFAFVVRPDGTVKKGDRPAEPDAD